MTIDSVWHPDDDDLLAWLLGDLSGARSEIVESHVGHCPVCSDRLEELEEARKLLGKLDDDSGHLEDRLAIKARVMFEATAQEQARRAFNFGRPAALITIAAAAALLLIWVSPTLGRATSDGISSLLSIVAPDDSPQLISDAAPPGQPQAASSRALATINRDALTFVPVTPEQVLDHPLQTTSQSASGDWITLTYGDPGQLQIKIIQGPEASGLPQFISGAQSFNVDGQNVAYLPEMLTGGVLRMFWTRGGIGFEVSVNESSGDALSLDQAQAIVRHFSEVQDQPIGGE